LLKGEKMSNHKKLDTKDIDNFIKNNSIVAFYFWTDWAHSCKPVKVIIEELAEEYKNDVVFVFVDADKNQKLNERFNIRSVPTVVVVNDGKTIKTLIGDSNKKIYVDLFNNLIKNKGEKMKAYKCTKTVMAEKMSYHEAGKLGLVRDYDKNKKDEDGYKVVYGDGYESWSPKDVFEEGYEPKTSKETPKVKSKTLGNTCANGATKNVKDIKFWGNGDLFKLISKASSEQEGWMKSTKAMDTGNGVVVQVTTQQRNPDGSYAVAEAVTFVPNVFIVENFDENNKCISRHISSK